MELGVFEILIGIAILFSSLYYYLIRNSDYWEKRGVVGPKPIPFFGNFKDVILGKTSEAIVLKNIYDKHKSEPLIGMFVKNNPRLVIRDPDLIKDVLIKDFSIFPDRGLEIHEKADPFSTNLVNLEYKRWKPLRSSLSPIFTSGKLRDMFYLITDCAKNFQKYILEQVVQKNEPVEVRELTAKFTTDSFGVCAFGLNMNAIDDEHSEFRNLGKKIFDVNFKNRLKNVLRSFFPLVYKSIGSLLKSNSDIQFFINSVKQTMKHRQQNNVRRNDFLDLLMDLKENSTKSSDLDITDNLLIAQAFLFFAAGFETSSTTISNTIYELALNPSIQDKLREEISEELAKNDGKLIYDCIKNMTYLDKVVKETLRKYPTGATLRRKTASAYTFNRTKVTIPKDMKVVIPVWAIHRDPDIYPDPEVYDPERFTNDNEKTRHSMNYLPFGDGPHNCIGLRFANYQTKMGVIAIIEKFQVDVCDKTCTEYRIEPRAPVITPIGGLYMKLSKV